MRVGSQRFEQDSRFELGAGPKAQQRYMTLITVLSWCRSALACVMFYNPLLARDP